MFLIFDTETTGLPRDYNAPLSDSDNWPRMVQVAWQLHGRNGNLLAHDSIIVKPEGYTIPFNAAQIHGITTERAMQEGQDLKDTLARFCDAVAGAEYLCGHNIGFDISIIGAEFIRCGLPDAFQGKKQLDTKCDHTTSFCAIPGGKGGKFKWPTLTELYGKLFNSTFQEAHNAAFDVQATSKVFFETVKRGIIPVPALMAEELQLISYEDVDLTALLQAEKAIKQAAKEAAAAASASTSKSIDVQSVEFTHLHTHSQYSVLQSVSDISDLVKKAAEYDSGIL